MVKKQEPDEGFLLLKRNLKNKELGKLYFFHGEESFLQTHYLEQIKKTLLNSVTEAFNYHKFNSESFSLMAFSDAVESMPMMSDTTFVQVDDIDIFKLNELDREKLIQTINDIPDYCTVVFSYLTVEWKPDKRLKKLWEAVSTKGCIVEFEKQNQRELVNWITRHFSAHKKSISGDLCLYLIGLTDGTMTSLKGEIDKVCAFSGSDIIVKADIDAVVEPIMDAVVFQMAEMLSAGALDQALLKLQQLIKLQQEPLAILGAIGSQFRRLGTAKTMMDNGKNSYEISKFCGMPEFAARRVMEIARSIHKDVYKKAAQMILETDYRMKTSYDDNIRLLELLVIQLAQEVRRG